MPEPVNEVETYAEYLLIVDLAVVPLPPSEPVLVSANAVPAAPARMHSVSPNDKIPFVNLFIMKSPLIIEIFPLIIGA